MDTRVLFALKQGPRSLEHHIREFSACAQDSDLPDIILIDIFCDGINQPLQTQLRREGPRSSLSCFLEFALTIGSLFTVGVAEEDHNTAPCHKMAADPEPQNSPAKPESALTRPAKPESPARMATTPVDAPLWPGLMTSVLDPPLVSVRAAGIPRFVAEPAPIRELAESAPEPAPIRELAESAPEPAPIRELAESAPEPAPIRELAESAPEPAPIRELAESAPEPAPIRELAESAPEPAPIRELAESAPEPAPIRELAESAPEPAPIRELAEPAPESAPEAVPI